MTVDSYARQHKNYLFHNKGNEHALIILSAIFSNSKEHIRMASHHLFNSEVVNTKKYIESMKAFLDKENTKLSIIISNVPSTEEILHSNSNSTFLGMLLRHPAYQEGRVKIKNGMGKSFHNAAGVSVNFCTGDDISYRLEDDINCRRATANFGDSETTQKLISSFDKVFNSLNEAYN